jgi:hypothetical protein
MANPSIQFAKLDLASATIYSTASNFNSFIRIRFIEVFSFKERKKEE